MNMLTTWIPPTTTTAWHSWCSSCGVPLSNHRLDCPQLNSVYHRADCRCPQCRPDVHINHRDVVECTRIGCGANT